MKNNFSKNSTFFALLIGFLCLPCIVVPLLFSLGLSSLFSLIFPWLAPFFIALAIVGFVAYMYIKQQNK